MPAVTISVSRYADPNSASMAAGVAVKGAAETQGFEVRVEKASEFQEPPRDHQQDHHITAGQGWNPGNHTRGGGENVGVRSQWLPGMTFSQPDWLASPI